jgi:hypothetical protein
MRRTVFVFGLIAGVFMVTLQWIIYTLCLRGYITFDNSTYVGYAGMLIVFSMVFFGIKSYRDNNGGRITFLKGLQVGILISLISAVCYAATWELYYPKVGDEFMKKYTAHELDKMKAAGASEAEIETARTEGEKFMELYKNFFVRFAFSIMEIAPVGIIVTLISALLLRRRELLPNHPVEAVG